MEMRALREKHSDMEGFSFGERGSGLLCDAGAPSLPLGTCVSGFQPLRGKLYLAVRAKHNQAQLSTDLRWQCHDTNSNEERLLVPACLGTRESTTSHFSLFIFMP